MALPNGDLITTVFDPQMAYPVDKRMQVDTLNSRDSISMFIRWEGMTVYVLENSKIYILQGGRSNEFWKELGTGSGTGGTTFVGQFPTADLLPTSGRSAGDYAFVGTGDDFVQYNWDNIANKWVMAEGQTDMASEFFHIGYKTPLRRPVIFPLFPKDVLVQESGDFVFAPETAVARFIFVGEVDAIRGIETAASDREIKLVNRTGSDIPLRDKSSGIPSGSGMDFGGTDYTWVNGTEITLKGNGTYWELAPNNQVAFSDHLDSISSTDTILPDNVTLKTNVINPHTLKPVGYRSTSTFIDGSPMDDAKVDGLIYQKIESKYFVENNFFNGSPVNVRDFGAKGDFSPITGDGTDDTLAFQNAFAFAKATSVDTASYFGRGVYIPAGVYKITDTINIYHSCTIYGEGIKISSIQSRITGSGKHVFQFLNTGGASAGITARDFGIHGQGSGASEGYAFRIDSVAVNTFRNLYIRDLGGGALWLTGGYVNWVNNCYFGYNGRNSFYSTVDGTQSFATIYVPRIGTGNSLHVTDCYISNNTLIDGIHFVGQTGRFTRCTTESGQRLIVIGEYATASRSIHIDDCYFEASRQYDIDIREAQEVVITNTFHNDTVGNTLAALKIGTLSNAKIEACHFGVRGIEVDRSNSNRVRRNVTFENCFGVNFNGGDHGLSGIKVLNNLEYNNASGGFGLSKNLWRASDDLTEWGITGTPTITQDATFLDGRPAYTMISTTAQAIFVNIPGVTVGEKLCFSFYIKGTSSSYIRFRGARVSDGVQEDFAGIRVAVSSGGWERHFISATVTDHSGTISARITTNTNGASICRAQLERGVLSPGIPIYTNGVEPVASNNIQGVTNGDHYVSGGIVKSSVDGSLWRETLDNNGNKILEKWVSNNWQVVPIPSEATTFTELTDTPANYTGHKNKSVKVNNEEDALVFVADGVDVRDVADGGSIAIELTDGFVSSRLNFTSSTAVTLQGLSNANGQTSLIAVNPHASNNLTIAHNGSGTVKYISPTSTDLVVAPKTAVRLEIVGNEMYPLVM